MNPQPAELRSRTKKFAVRIMRLCDVIPTSPSGRAVAAQLVRSGMSVGANYRAACRGRSRAEFIAKLGIVVEEADETQYWLELLAETGLIKLSQLTPLMKEAGELVAIFTAGQRTAKQNS
jgi:four helix bundle protein